MLENIDTPITDPVLTFFLLWSFLMPPLFVWPMVRYLARGGKAAVGAGFLVAGFYAYVIVIWVMATYYP
jgi:hypothetical protein